MAVDIKKLFNEDLPAGLAKNGDDAKQLAATYQLNISGDDGGEWWISANDTAVSCESSANGVKPADCTLTITSEDFQKLLENPQANGMQLFFAGKLKVAGNQMLAMKLQKLFSFK